MQRGKLCTDRCPKITNQFFQFDYKYLSYIVTARLNRKFIVRSSNNTTSKYHQSLGDQLRDSEQITGESENTDPIQRNLLRDLPEGQKSSKKISKTKECQHHGLAKQIRNLQEKWYR